MRVPMEWKQEGALGQTGPCSREDAYARERRYVLDHVEEIVESLRSRPLHHTAVMTVETEREARTLRASLPRSVEGRVFFEWRSGTLGPAKAA